MRIVCVVIFILAGLISRAQPDEKRMGAWYMFFYQKKFNDSRFGLQGDLQYRAWNLLRDKEQLLLRSGITYRPASADILFTLGYAYISTGSFGSSKVNVAENRIYQEVLLPQKLSPRFQFTHRFRFEQRWVENQDMRTRFRYNLFLNLPFNKAVIEKNTVYLALYNEIFINGQKNIGGGAMVDLFDRNRAYAALGYGIADQTRLQAGIMRQSTAAWSKNQWQLSLHQKW